MRNKALVKDYVSRSSMRLAAIETLLKLGGYADVVRESQEVLELVSKALVRHLGGEPARVHDVSVQLSELSEKLGSDQQTGLNHLIEASRELRRDRELAYYGTEDLTPSEFYSEKDALHALKLAQESVLFVKTVVKRSL